MADLFDLFVSEAGNVNKNQRQERSGECRLLTVSQMGLADGAGLCPTTWLFKMFSRSEADALLSSAKAFLDQYKESRGPNAAPATGHIRYMLGLEGITVGEATTNKEAVQLWRTSGLQVCTAIGTLNAHITTKYECIMSTHVIVHHEYASNIEQLYRYAVLNMCGMGET